jgi:hypothetical protein
MYHEDWNGRYGTPIKGVSSKIYSPEEVIASTHFLQFAGMYGGPMYDIEEWALLPEEDQDLLIAAYDNVYYLDWEQLKIGAYNDLKLLPLYTKRISRCRCSNYDCYKCKHGNNHIAKAISERG